MCPRAEDQSDPRRAALDRFLADNPELEQLSAHLATFNVFRALKIEHMEIRHSNVLAWLLDPNESHGLDEVVLRRVLSNMLLESEADIGSVSAAQIELMDFSDVEVRREWRNIDILVIDWHNRLVVVIENKVGGVPDPAQLHGYTKMVEEDPQFAGFTVVPVMLTLLPEESEGEAEDAFLYVRYAHSQVLAVLERIIDQRAAQMPETVGMFLRQYTDSLRRLTMQDEELSELCRAIYRRHREAIDLIVEYGQQSVLVEAVEEALAEDGGHEVLRTKPNFVAFLPASWRAVVPENAQRWQDFERPVSVIAWMQLNRQRDKIRFVFEVCQMDDASLRLACVEALRDAGFRLTKKAFHENAVYSRFYSATQKVADFTDVGAVTKSVKILLGKAIPHIEKAAGVLGKVFGHE